MDNVKTDFNKIELIKKLEILRELEMKKPINEIDTDFIDEIVLFGLELKGLRTSLTPEEVEEKVRKIPFVEKTTTLNTPPTSVKGRATKVKSRKILLIAAIISILVAIFTVSSIAFDWNIFEELKNRFGTVADTPVNQEIEVDGISVYMYGENKVYKNIENVMENEDINILFPTQIPENIRLNKIMLYQHETNNEIVFIFSDNMLSYSVTFNKTIPDTIISVATEITKIDGFDCYVIDKTDVGVTQIHFEYKGNSYEISYNNKQDLIEIIKNLKESE